MEVKWTLELANILVEVEGFKRDAIRVHIRRCRQKKNVDRT